MHVNVVCVTRHYCKSDFPMKWIAIRRAKGHKGLRYHAYHDQLWKTNVTTMPSSLFGSSKPQYSCSHLKMLSPECLIIYFLLLRNMCISPTPLTAPWLPCLIRKHLLNFHVPHTSAGNQNDEQRHGNQNDEQTKLPKPALVHWICHKFKSPCRKKSGISGQLWFP